ncbi:helix-turn-helix domain-containing protein [Haloarcula laminariae]|uniref:helix-turn-helix domain-containing protein n=1 Tax=Haloarcula laminariae TaxID=2961577 RepID=UPI0021CA926D|nr:helix-turn-helix domain-containing protein [Halomicroarcula laminariae]
MYARPTNDENARIDTEPGLTPAHQAPLATAATVDLDGGTVTDLWRDLLDADAVREAFVRAVRAFARDRTTADLLDALDDRDVPVHLHSKIDAVARGDRREAWHLAADVVPALGQSWTTTEDLLATASLFDALPSTPTLAVRLGEGFRDRRRDQRADVCRLLDALARGFDVSLVVSNVTRLWLAQEHREHLPGVSEWCSTDRDCGPLSGVVDDALATLDADGRPVSLLRRIAEEPGETTTYHALYAAVSVGESRVRQCIADLVDLGLVATFGPDEGRKVELLDAGREFLQEIPQQRTLPESVSDTPQHSQQGRVTTRSGQGGTDRRPYQTAYLSRPHHTATVACGTTGGVNVVEHPEEPADTDRTRWVSYDESRDEAVISVRATGAMQYAVSVALALSSPRLLDAVPSARLAEIDDPPAILRDARCIGALSDATLAEGTVRDAFVEWGEELADMTTALHRGEYDDRDAFRGEIIRSAHGLAGSVVHLLDAVGVDVTREVRVPGGLSFDKLDSLAESIGVSTAIQSSYGAFAAYRQLLETRDDKRRSALSPTVDATDPFGELLGSVVVRGPDVDRLRPALAEHLEDLADPVDDAPEFAVRIPLRTVGREAFATAATRTLKRKGLSPTRPAVSVCHALAGSPYDVARSLHQLSPEEDGRDVRLDEVRYALATLSADRIVPDLPPTAGALISTLLAAEKPLSQSTLSDRADVSPQSIRRHRDRLTALGVLTFDAGEYRLALSFQTPEERRDAVAPDMVGERFRDAVDALLLEHLPPDRYADPEDAVAGALFHPPDPWGIVDAEPTLRPWVDLAAALTATARPSRTLSVSVGPTVEQEPLSTEASEVSAGSDAVEPVAPTEN